MEEPQLIVVDFSEYDILIGFDFPAYIDPPYKVKASMLYHEYMNDSEHVKLAEILRKRNNWVLSYDDEPGIRELYKNNKIIDLAARYSINGKKTKWESKNELIILSK